ncbi:MAG: hypothetical protein K0Q56_2444 [Sporolactobacillus laevolacticus]|nr:hypothetical protein [Sporolactobacillus laevolacticus]
MSTRALQVIWFKIQTQNGKSVRLHFPISLYVLLELLDCFLVLIKLVCLFAPKRPSSGSHISIHAIKELIPMLMELLRSITKDGPYDLVDVAADNVKVSIRIR